MAVRTLRPLRCSFTLASLALLGALSGCGRTDLGDYLIDEVDAAAEQEIEATRELTLADARVVYVELLSPAPDSAHDGLMTAPDGIELEVLVERLVPEGNASLIWDNTGDLPMLKIETEGSVRALLWI